MKKTIRFPEQKKKEDKPVQSRIVDVDCPECRCDVLLPLVRMKAIQSFGSPDHIQIEWPYKQNDREYARVACPSCGMILSVAASGAITDTGYRMIENFPKGKK